MMVSQRRLFTVVTVFVLIGLLLVACERPLPGGSSDDSEATPIADSSGGELTTDENAGGGTPNEADSGAIDDGGASEAVDSGEPADTPRDDTSSDDTGSDGAYPGTEEADAPTEEEAAPVEEPSDEATAEDDEAAGEEAEAPAADADAEAGGGTPEGDEAAGDNEAAGEEAEAPATDANAEAGGGAPESEEATSGDVPAATERPATHTVAAGENLYRIGLQYGVSWVTLAQHNGLTNANRIVVGQVLKIPGAEVDGGQAVVEPTPSPQTEEIYTVKAGDNLYRIGLAYGLNWTQIAEANGILNPNQIMVGQQLKIPVDKPSETQQSFVHTVQPNETLFLISLRYGVAWTAIAEENELESPYVIFPGQTLAIPSK